MSFSLIPIYLDSTFFAFGMPATPEWMFLGILALILFGPQKLPGIAKGFGKFMFELQKAKEEFRREILNIPTLPSIKEPLEKKPYQTTQITKADPSSPQDNQP